MKDAPVPYHLYGPMLGSLQRVFISLVLLALWEAPELDTALQLCLQRAVQRRITSLGLLTTQCSPGSCWHCLVQVYTAGSCCPLGPQGCSLQSCFTATQGVTPSCLVPLNVRRPMWYISHSFQFCTNFRESTSHLPGTTLFSRILQGIKWYKHTAS